jgi:hypothetical protein
MDFQPITISTLIAFFGACSRWRAWFRRRRTAPGGLRRTLEVMVSRPDRTATVIAFIGSMSCKGVPEARAWWRAREAARKPAVDAYWASRWHLLDYGAPREAAHEAARDKRDETLRQVDRDMLTYDRLLPVFEGAARRREALIAEGHSGWAE